LPEGSELFLLPDRFPIGYNPAAKRFQVLSADPWNPYRKTQAVAAFMAPAHTQIYSAAYETLTQAPLLPLFAYAAVGWLEGAFVVAGFRVDTEERQDPRHFNQKEIRQAAKNRMKREPGNRLIQHLGKCALTYGCPAACNLFLNRWEAPLPSSPLCNAGCLGCISLQEHPDLCATQDRITFVPNPEEICGVAIPHLQKAPKAVVSFGQGCEGEPLLQAAVIEKAVNLMRKSTSRGTINLNTNASRPEKVKGLVRAGLDSMRISLNSCRPEYYSAYFNPQGYAFEDVKRSILQMKAGGGFASINYFVLPGFTDSQDEFKALCSLIKETGLDLIQMRNLNIDPEWYLRSIGFKAGGKGLGIPNLMACLREQFPDLRFGYYNPCLDPSI
jgi:pyruvate-formate lyase-activating enzyme